MKKHSLLIALSVLLFAVSSCKTSHLTKMKDGMTTTDNNSYQDMPPILEKYWKLVEINGKPVTPSDEMNREAFMILAMDNKVTGNSSCNSFMGSYELLEGNRITFSQIASTMMACMNMDIEKQLFEVLERADNYTLNNDTLMLNKARMAPLAVFEAVYLD